PWKLECGDEALEGVHAHAGADRAEARAVDAVEADVGRGARQVPVPVGRLPAQLSARVAEARSAELVRVGDVVRVEVEDREVDLELRADGVGRVVLAEPG